MSKEKKLSYMTKDKLMTYTFIALLVLVGVSYLSWGITSLITSAIAVLIAIGIDYLLYKVAVDSPLNTMSAAVFGLIVALSYSLGVPSMYSEQVLPLLAPEAYVYVALITVVGMVVFKKIQGLAGRKYVNPAAAAKLLVLLPFVNTVLIAKDHLTSSMLGVPALAGPIGYELLGDPPNGVFPFAYYIKTCFADPASPIAETVTSNEIYNLMVMQKFHGWVGGASSLAVIIVGIALFVVCRRYIKWRVTAAYLGTVALLALALSFVYADGDPLLRILFHLFIGSSIFLAFFMATDPATTPLTHVGQIIFGVGLGLFTVLIQTYLNFFGGSILALVLMNLTTPLLDNVGWLTPSEEKCQIRKMPKAKVFTTLKTTECIRCGACMRVCCHNLSSILIKEAFEKDDVKKLKRLRADLCEGCGNCVFVCPAKINIRASNLRASALLRKQK